MLTGKKQFEKSRVVQKAQPDIYHAIYAVIATIPRGRVASYGEIATRAGLPRRARLVGTALRHTPRTTRLPWHRVLRADGSIAFPKGSASYREQRQRLLTEGVEISRGRVDFRRFGWQSDIDAEIWAP